MEDGAQNVRTFNLLAARYTKDEKSTHRNHIEFIGTKGEYFYEDSFCRSMIEFNVVDEGFKCPKVQVTYKIKTPPDSSEAATKHESDLREIERIEIFGKQEDLQILLEKLGHATTLDIF